jgi:hypothetical protein
MILVEPMMTDEETLLGFIGLGGSGNELVTFNIVFGLNYQLLPKMIQDLHTVGTIRHFLT